MKDTEELRRRGQRGDETDETIDVCFRKLQSISVLCYRVIVYRRRQILIAEIPKFMLPVSCVEVVSSFELANVENLNFSRLSLKLKISFANKRITLHVLPLLYRKGYNVDIMSLPIININASLKTRPDVIVSSYRRKLISYPDGDRKDRGER